MSKKIIDMIKEGRMDVRVRSLVESTIEMEKAIDLWSKVNDSKTIKKHFNKVKNEVINSARESGITNRELKIIGLVHKTKRTGNLKESNRGLFKNIWNTPLADIKRYIKENKLKPNRINNKDGSFVYCFDKKKELLFKYDLLQTEMYTNYKLEDFVNKKFK